MENYIVGALVATAFWMLLSHAKKNKILIAWWQWAMTALCGLFVVFTLAVIFEFIHEGTLQGAVVSALVLGVTSVIWSILTWRFIFAVKQNQQDSGTAKEASE